MTDYISREAAINFIDAGRLVNPNEPRWSDNEVVAFMKKIPAADVVPVVHAEWIENDNGTWSCGRCNSWIPNEQHFYARYCLHCGAIMDGGETDATVD